MATQTVALKTQVENLPNNSKGQGFNLLLTIKAADLTASVADDLNSFTITIPADSRYSDMLLELITPFENTADTGNNTTTVSVGDNSAVTTFMSATEVNKNGSYITTKTMTGSIKAYTAANTLKVVFTPKSTYALTVLNKGELRVYARRAQLGDIG